MNTEIAKGTSARFSPPMASRTDAQITEAVRSALEWDEFVPHKGIRTTVSRGRVTLEGDVTTPAEKNYVERVVRLLSGVAGVQNLLRVVRS
jgi:osmotically-inducible protein OsmY